ncbi:MULTISPECIES: DUF3553 domain-containing protein [Thiorhodovibrio]|uniref:DUF3553 domain-containing protein n=1 Tax=Thiorhodovibrio TaxID=61593 RepID=UPI001914107C|nr:MULTISPECIES: DUF3553 domain-containing protein [Thiorhodovibrio]MBK5970464.1 hypothetical protein [Thiorhodovibrio winogradskyi]WPL11411.1 hypothetical protein Thiosp_01146 [Thiorhodovibrio litoralis]
MPFKVGDRVKHPKKLDWGLGEVTASGGGNVTVHFVDAGEKKLSLNHVALQLVTGDDAVSPQLDQIRQEPVASKTVRYRIRRVPRTTAAQNVRTWGILEQQLATVRSASYEQLVRWAKDHDHARGGRGFIDYCIDNGWLEADIPEPSVTRAGAEQPAAGNRGSSLIPDQDERPMAVADITPAGTTDRLLQDYIHGCFGYGSLSAPLWFIGMEEGTGQESLDERLQAWQDLGRTATLDIRLFHERIHEARWFSLFPTIQRTWRRLIIVALRYLGEPVDKERIRHYQASRLAMETEALLELMPLPHKGLGEWDHQGLFASRHDYLSAVAPRRLAELQKAVASNDPKAVVMYGTTPPYPKYWQTLAGGPLTGTEQGWSYRRSGRTLYVVCQHPVAHGVTDDSYASIGDFLREGEKRPGSIDGSPHQ